MSKSNLSNSQATTTATTIHNLHSPWTMYFYKMDKQRDWKDNMYKIHDIDSIERFWCVMHHMKPVSNLPYGCDYYLFRQHIGPMWENPFNKDGGMWVISSHQSKRQQNLNETWMEILMFLVGETLGEDSDEICGVAINVRGQYDKITIWTRDCTKNESNKRIGLGLKSLLNLTNQIEYFSHHSNQNKKERFGPKPTLVV